MAKTNRRAVVKMVETEECGVPGCQESHDGCGASSRCAAHRADERAIIVGQRVELGASGTEAYDYGKVVACNGDRVTVAWVYRGTNDAHASDELRRGLSSRGLMHAINGDHRPAAKGARQRLPLHYWADMGGASK